MQSNILSRHGHCISFTSQIYPCLCNHAFQQLCLFHSPPTPNWYKLFSLLSVSQFQLLLHQTFQLLKFACGSHYLQDKNQSHFSWHRKFFMVQSLLPKLSAMSSLWFSHVAILTVTPHKLTFMFFFCFNPPSK